MALKGIKVVELAGLAPGPFCGMLLSDFGATVTRIIKTKDNTAIDCLNEGKTTIAVNVKHPSGAEIVHRISDQSDVLIEPFRPGVMEKLHLSPEVLTKSNPRLIYARLTGFGQTGYYSTRAGHDINYLGLSGLLSLFGRKDAKPTFPVNFVADFAGGGLNCAFGILLALIERSASGKGQVVDCSMVEGSAYAGSWLFRSQNAPFWGKPRGENVLDSGAHFYEVYETKDKKFMSVGALEPQFYSELLKGLELDVKDVPQSDFEGGKAIFTKIFAQKTQKEWCEIFDNRDACVFPVLDLNDVVEFKHNINRQSFVKNNKTIIPNPSPKLSRTPGTSSIVKSKIQTKIVLKQYGYSDEDIVKLEQDSVIH